MIFDLDKYYYEWKFFRSFNDIDINLEMPGFEILLIDGKPIIKQGPVKDSIAVLYRCTKESRERMLEVYNNTEEQINTEINKILESQEKGVE